MIACGKAILAYLPVSFLVEPENKSKNPVANRQTNLNTKKIYSWHFTKCTAFCLRSLKDIALKGIQLNTSDNVNMPFHFVLTSYVADESEAEFLLVKCQLLLNDIFFVPHMFC